MTFDKFRNISYKKVLITITLIAVIYGVFCYAKSYYDINILNYTNPEDVVWNYYVKNDCKSKKNMSSQKMALIRADIKATYVDNTDNWIAYCSCGFNNVENELDDFELPDKPTKVILGMSGCDSIVSKANLWNIVCKYYDHDIARELLPNTYLYTKKDLARFYNDYIVNPDRLYILKKNLQRKEGILVTNDYKTIMGGNDDKFVIMQEYLEDPYLIDGRKLNLRIYLLFCYHGSAQYIFRHKQGKCIYTNKKYDKYSDDFETHITSFHLDPNIYDRLPLTTDNLYTYLSEQGKYTDYHSIMQNIDKNLALIAPVFRQTLYQRQSHKKHISTQLFALDYVIDENHISYLLEANKGPDMMAKNKKDEELKHMVLDDMMTIIGLRNSGNQNNWINIIS
jgi:hypothetical protein